MSHNSKYYRNKIRKTDSKGSHKLSKLWASQSSNDIQSVNNNAVLASDSCQSEVQTESTSPPTQSDHASSSASSATVTQGTDKESSDHDCTVQDPCLGDDKDPVSIPCPDARSFDHLKYQSHFEWLYYNINKGGMMCKYCELFPCHSNIGDSKWGQAAVQLKENPSRRLLKHQDSKHHKDATIRYEKTLQSHASSKSKKRSVYQLLKRQSSSKEKDDKLRNREILKKLFRVVYYVSRKYWAQTQYGDLVKFMAELGVPEFEYHLETAPWYATYLSDGTASELINIIGNYIENKLLQSIRKADFFTLMADESTDEQNREQLSIYIKWPSSADGLDHFIGMVHIERANAESLMQAIQVFCTGKGIDLAKCKYVGFDGANVMSGEVSGLQRRVRHVSPHCLYMNCRNHRLALCLKHLMKDYPLLVDADETLLAIWKLFDNSPQRFAVFQNVQQAYGDKKITMIRAATTRWLSHGDACVRFIDRFCECLDTLDQIYDNKREPEVLGLRIAMTNHNTVMMILLLCDLLRPVNTLSESLQKADINFMDVDSKVKACTNELQDLINKLNHRNDYEIYFAKCDQILGEIVDRTDLRRRHRGENFLDPDTFVREKALPFIYSLIGEISDAFVCHPVFKAFKALDPRELPDELDELADHGRASIDRLVQHYATEKEDVFKGHMTRCPADIDSADLLQAEYAGFKHQMFMLRQTHRGNNPERVGELGPTQLLAKMDADPVLKTCFRRIYKLVQLMCIIPTSTAVVERGFSTMNLLCTAERSTLLQTKLSSLMMICVEGPEELLNDDLEHMCNIFRDAKARKMSL